MTGIDSYCITAADNVQANTGIDWDEGMAPGQVNNSARQNMADMRDAFNDLIWFQYGSGSKAPAPAYAGSTSFTQASASDLSAVYHVGRRVKAVGSGTGTIYGTISAPTAYATGTQTVTVTWDSGSLHNEALTIYLSQIPVTGSPVAAGAVGSLTVNNSNWSGTQLSAANGGTGITALGTGVATALGVNVGSDGAPVIKGGALGTPSSGVATNLTGTATGLTAGTANALNTGNDYTIHSLTANGAISAAGDITGLTSDDRLKERLGEIENALNKVQSLTAFYYRNNKKAAALGLTDGMIRVGLSAQEVKLVMPEVVRPFALNPAYMTVMYDKLVPLLVAAIQELGAELESLRRHVYTPH